MMNERALPAESVSELLEMARMRQVSGRLAINQQSRGSVQEGEVYLKAGQPVSARLGSLVGQEALSRLVSWRTVQYILQPDEPGTAPPGLPGSRSEGVPSSPAQSDRNPLTGSEASRASSPGPSLSWQVPHRRGVDQDVLTLPLTRRQRVIYLLIDGHRALADLSRCSGRALQDVELIVKELQVQGLVDI